MKKNYLLFFKIFILFLLLNVYSIRAQVGIGTSSPKGVLDVESTQYGVVYPSVALTATNVEAPVINPTTDPLETGTTVYNTNTTNNGSFDVEPGIYSWDGNIWVRHYYKRQVEGFKQTGILRTKSAGSFQVVPGFPTAQPKTFFAKYTGLYKIELKLNYGGGAMVDNSDINVGLFEGDFQFTFSGSTSSPFIIHAKSFSTFNKYIGGISGTQFSNISSQVYKTIYVNLVSGTTYTFSLEFDQYPDPDPALGTGYLNNGNSGGGNGDGRGYVGKDIFCIIEFTYLKE
jgi:hypothetical protein